MRTGRALLSRSSIARHVLLYVLGVPRWLGRDLDAFFEGVGLPLGRPFGAWLAWCGAVGPSSSVQSGSSLATMIILEHGNKIVEETLKERFLSGYVDLGLFDRGLGWLRSTQRWIYRSQLLVCDSYSRLNFFPRYVAARLVLR